MLRNTIIALLEPGTTGMQKHMFSSIHWEYIYLMFSDVINKRRKEKANKFKTIKRADDVYKTSRAVWRWIRSMTKLDIRYTELVLQKLLLF